MFANVRIEAETRHPRLSSLMRLADGYGVTLDVLVRFTIEDGDIRGVPLSGAERELLESRRAATAARLGRNRERATRRDGADR